MSGERPRFVVKWTRRPPSLYMLLEHRWVGERRVAAAVWVYKAGKATGFLSEEDASSAFERMRPGAWDDYAVRPLSEEMRNCQA